MDQFIILDGLDECNPVERKAVMQIMNDIVYRCDGDKQGKVRVLVVSTDLPDIRKWMTSEGILDLSPTDIQRDIDHFVSKQIEALREEKKLPLTEDDAQRIQRLSRRANGGKPLKSCSTAC